MRIYNISNCKPNNFYTTFNGRIIKGKMYSDETIKIAKEYLLKKTHPRTEDFQKDFLDCIENSKIQPLEWAFMPLTWYLQKVTGEKSELTTKEISRISVGICTLGLSELLKAPEAGIRKLVDKSQSEKKVKEILECMLALKEEGEG